MLLEHFEIVAIKAIFASPLKEFCNTLVNFEARYGIKDLVEPFKAEITFPNAFREELIDFASSSRTPLYLYYLIV